MITKFIVMQNNTKSSLYQELYSLTKIFILSASVFATALGNASTDLLKLGISSIGLISSLIWFMAALNICKTTNDPKYFRFHILVLMPFVFVLGWSLSIYVHYDQSILFNLIPEPTSK